MNQKVPLLNLQEQYRQIGSELEQAVVGVLRSGNYILGEYGSRLERDVAEVCGTKHGIGVANGTDALVLALWALDIGPGDEVITTPFTFAATVEAIMIRGAKPVFVDVDAQSFNIQPAQIEQAITSKTKAILPVHLYGQPAHMEPIMSIAKRFGLRVVEDNAQAIGALYKEQPTGSFGDLACISFYPTKNLGAVGDAGMVVTNDEALADRLKTLRAHGSRRRYHHDELGVNSRLDEVQAAALCAKLPYLQVWNQKRHNVATLYERALRDCPNIVTPAVSLPGFAPSAAASQVRHVWHQYTVRVIDKAGASGALREHVIKELNQRGIGSMCYYPVPLHLQKAFETYGYKRGDFPVTERISDEVLSLPMYPELTDEQIAYVGESLKQIMAETPAVVPSSAARPTLIS